MNPFSQETKNPFALDVDIVTEDITSYKYALSTRHNAAFFNGEQLNNFVKLDGLPTAVQSELLIEESRASFIDDTKELVPVMVEQYGAQGAANELKTINEDAPATAQEARAYKYYPGVGWDLVQLENYKIAQLQSEATVAEITRDILLPTLTIDAAQMTDANGKVTAKGYFSVEDKLKEIHEAYIGLPLGDREDYLDTIIAQATAFAENNRSTAAQIVRAIINGPGSEFWLDRAGLASLPFDIIGGLKAVANMTRASIKATTALKTTANLRQRAAIANAAVEDAEVAKKAGITQEGMQLGIYDAHSKFDTGVPPEIVYELDNFSSNLRGWEASLDNSVEMIQPATADEALFKLDIEGIGSKIKVGTLPPDNALGRINEEALIYPNFLASTRLALSDAEHLKPIITSITNDVKGSGIEDIFSNTLFKLDESKTEWTWEQYFSEFNKYTNNQKAEKAATAAIKYRQLAQSQYFQLDAELVAERKAEGFTKYIDLGEGNYINVKPYDDIESARVSIGQSGINRAWDLSENKSIKLDNLDDIYDNGKIVVRSDSLRDTNALPGTDSVWTYTVVPLERLNDIKHALKYRAGYVPKFNKNLRYLVKVPVAGKINGRSTKAACWKVDHGFSTSQKARDYAQEIAKEKGLSYNDIRVVPTREFSTEDTLRAHDVLGGNMFTSARKTEPLLIDGKLAVREKDPIESIDRAANYLQRKRLLHKVTQIAEDEWFKAAKAHNALPSNYYGAFSGAAADLNALDKAVESKLRDLHNYISRRKANNFGRASDVRTFAVKLAERMPNDTVLSRAMWDAVDIDILGKGKALVYHTFMGLGSVSQLPVQASGLLLPLAKHPVAFSKSLPHIIYAFYKDFIPELGRRMLQKVPAEQRSALQASYALWRESGLAQSMSINPDYARLSSAGYAEKLETLSSFFVEKGEALSRMGSFFTAVQLEKGKSMRAVLSTARRLGMDLTAANKNWWQEGIPGLFLQFQQILAKTYGEMMPTALGGKTSISPAERGRMWFVMLSAYGIAGMPFGSVIDSVAHKLIPNDTDPDFVEAYKRGLSGVLMNHLDWDNDIQSRTSLATAFPHILEKLLIDSEISAHELMGPIGTVYQRAAQAYREVKEGIRQGNFTAMLRGIGSVPSSTRSAIAAYVYTQTGMLYSLENKAYANIDLNQVETLLLAAGFQSTELQDTYTYRERVKARKQALDYVVDTALKAHRLGELSAEDTAALGSLLGADPDLFNDFKLELRTRMRDVYKEPIRDSLIKSLLEDSNTYGIPTASRLINE